MTGLQMRKMDKYERELAFMTDNAADFPKDSRGEVTTKRFGQVIARIRTLAAAQTSRQVNQNLEIKDEAMAKMINMCQKINRAGNTLGEEIEGIEDLFRLPRKRTEAIWLATARAFHRDSEPYEAEIQSYIKTPTFRAVFQTLIDQVQQAMTEADIAGEQKGGATGGLTAEFREAGMLSRRLNTIVLDEYDDDAQKLAAWDIASHLEAAPQKAKETPQSKKDEPANK